MAKGRRLQKQSHSPLLWVCMILFWLLFVLALIVVAGYIALSLFVQAPEVPTPTPPPSAVVTVIPSDDPATPSDESEEGPTVIPTDTPEPRQRKEDCHTFLLVGVDDGNGGADTIMVVTYDVPNQKVTVASVPRDTLMDVPRTVKKINAAYGAGGITEVQKEVSQLLGYPVDHYIMVDLRAFKALVNKLGGVDFYVPMDMDYDDPDQDLHIHLKKGMQHLDGDKALQLVRFRSGYQNADIGRIETQQKFLTALAKKLLSWNSVTKINEFVDIFAKYVRTDLTTGNMAYFGISALQLDLSSGLKLYTLPGDGLTTYKGIPYYYELDPQGTLDIINSGLNPYTEELTMADTSIFQIP